MIYKIESVENGYIATSNNTFDGPHKYVSTSLTELAKIIEPNIFPKDPDTNIYAPGYTKNDLIKARQQAQLGNKITAIKLLREVYVNRLGLQEAKDLVEMWM